MLNLSLTGGTVNTNVPLDTAIGVGVLQGALIVAFLCSAIAVGYCIRQHYRRHRLRHRHHKEPYPYMYVT